MITYCPVCTTTYEIDDEVEVVCDTCLTPYRLSPVFRDEPVQDKYAAILFCPRCCDAFDSSGTGWQKFRCPSGHEFATKIDAAVVAEHGRFG